jgi:plastocyanin
MRKLLGGLVVITMALALASCGDDDDSGTVEPAGDGGGGGGSTVSVTAANLAFDPTSAEVTAGSVHFAVTNEDQAPHTFTIDDAGVDIQLDAGSTGEADADLEAGEYEFRCTIHPAMTGTITVT